MTKSVILAMFLVGVGLASGPCVTSALAAPITQADLGAITNGSGASGTLGATEVHWYSFSLGAFTYFDVTSNGSLFDTEIGLYTAAGNLVADDDDEGIGLASTLSFGTGSGMTLGDSFNLGGNGLAEGEDGALGPGTYYLGIGRFPVRFESTSFDVVSSSSSGGDYVLTFYTDNGRSVAPEPSTLLLLGTGLAGAAYRRRRKA